MSLSKDLKKKKKMTYYNNGNSFKTNSKIYRYNCIFGGWESEEIRIKKYYDIKNLLDNRFFFHYLSFYIKINNSNLYI